MGSSRSRVEEQCSSSSSSSTTTTTTISHGITVTSTAAAPESSSLCWVPLGFSAVVDSGRRVVECDGRSQRWNTQLRNRVLGPQRRRVLLGTGMLPCSVVLNGEQITDTRLLLLFVAAIVPCSMLPPPSATRARDMSRAFCLYARLFPISCLRVRGWQTASWRSRSIEVSEKRDGIGVGVIDFEDAAAEFSQIRCQ